MPQISYIVATYNSESTIRKCLDCLHLQKDVDIEVIVVDGGSLDGTTKIVKEYAGLITHFLSEHDSGIYEAWNKGVRLSSSPWIAFVGSDDYLNENAARVLLHEGEKSSECEYVSAKVNVVDVDGKLLKTIGKPWSWATFRRTCWVAHVGSLHKKELFDRHGYFDEGFAICGDYEFLLRAKGDLKATFVDYIIGDMSAGGVSYLSKKSLQEAYSAKVMAGSAKVHEAALDYFVASVKLLFKRFVGKYL